MRSISWVGVLLITACVLGVGLVSGCQGTATKNEAKVSSEAVKARTSTGAEAIEVKDLDHPDNPYLGQYGEWDQWVFANMVSMPKAWKLGEYPENWESLSAEVDENGYIIPMLESVRRREIAITEGKQSECSNDVYIIYGEGELPEDMMDEYLHQAELIRVSYIPTIPTWLIENLPPMAMLFPNGDVITMGELGDTSSDCCSGKKQVWYRYNSEGALTGESKVVWWEIYYSEKYGKESWPEGDFENRMDGYVMFRDRVTGQILSVYDYDGTQMESKVPPPVRDSHPFMYFNRRFLVKYYELQNS